ncbi:MULTISPECIES: hypothetical protein [Moorena]|uniref:Uncharacterized protein n=1 Tax=Moorena producens 3L TaxID=489825 RepID=F4XJU6_9CYAN|nr:MULTISPECIES: hypothetical protein [Moorena]EGJ35376.1 hypothetical protein LYNGBM3L_08390 [Moorena producens 3L]OLT65596.1 hypothetical protein BI334_11645 [Moorena producens 3L]
MQRRPAGVSPTRALHQDSAIITNLTLTTPGFWLEAPSIYQQLSSMELEFFHYPLLILEGSL